jgi:serine/threonine protein kinase
MALGPGVMLNHYRVVKLLGQGGFGAVYRAWDIHLNRACALKENLDTTAEAQRQFEREAQILASLTHPNLPRVTDHFFLPGRGQYLVMDYIEGEDLASLVFRQGPVEANQAIAWISQIADALTYLHSQQQPVVHRDVKPANIRLTPDGRVVLVDFGLAKVYDPLLRTTVGAWAVTPGYSSPEQYGQGNTNARTDLYALAATLYTLLTGQEPMESIQRVVGSHLTPAHQVNGQVTPQVGRIIEQAMHLNPSQRYPATADFKRALERTIGGSSSGPSLPGGITRNYFIAAGAAVAILLCVVVGAGGLVAQIIGKDGSGTAAPLVASTAVSADPSATPTPTNPPAATITRAASTPTPTRPLPTPTPTLAGVEYGDRVVGVVTTSRNALWQFFGRQGEQVNLIVEPTTSDFDLTVDVLNTAGNSILEGNGPLDASFGTEEINNLVIPTTGSYTIVVAGFGGSTGQFALSLELADDGEIEPAGSGGVAIIVAEDDLPANDEHAFPFTTLRPSTVSIEVVPENGFDVVVEVYRDQTGTDDVQLEEVDASFGRESINFIAEEADDYYFRITGYNGDTGHYTVTLIGTADVVFELTYDDNVSGQVAADSHVDFYFFADAGERFTIQVMPESGFDVVVEIHNTSNQLLADEDSSLDNETITFTAPADGLYTIRLRGFAGDSGNFTMTVEP